MAGFNFINEVENESKRITSNEQLLGLGLKQPFNPLNSGSRKIMSESHDHQELPLKYGEKAIVETGYEIRYGDRSSSIIIAESDYEVIAKISKFSFLPNHIYYLLLRDIYIKEIKLIERTPYKFQIEVYGYLYNNSYLDSLRIGDRITKGTIIRKSMGFDEYNNMKTGLNANCVYLADERNMEDSLLMSDVFAQKSVSPIFKKGKAIKNENDIPLNLYGNNDVYKVFPDIGEMVQSGVLMAFSRESKDEFAYSQSYERLKNFNQSNTKYTVGKGTLIDIDICCNNPEDIMSSIYNSQLARYYQESMRVANEFVTLGSNFMANKIEIDNNFQNKYVNSQKMLNGNKFIDDKKVFSGTMIRFMVLEDRPSEPGDKWADRYGGKGVISYIIPQHLMPKIKNENGIEIYADVIVNQSTMYNRENPGQMIELSSTYIAQRIIEYISLGVLEPDESLELIRKYYSFIENDIAYEFEKFIENLNQDEKKIVVDSFINDNRIDYSCRPMSNSLNIDKLSEMYDEFSFAKQKYLIVPIEDSNGDIRYIQSRRKTVLAPKYMRRLKQFAEEKFSANSLSATNITNMNSRSKASKEYKEPFSNTPIKFGNMETGDMTHLSVEKLITNMMIHSLSPHGRRMAEQMYTGDPFHVNIKLDSQSKNRSVEKLNAYLKTCAIRLRFIKVRKIVSPAIARHAISFNSTPDLRAAIIDHKYNNIYENYLHMLHPYLDRKDGLQSAIHFIPIKIYDNMSSIKNSWKDE